MANDVTIHVNYRDLDNAFESARELHELLRTMGRANYRINFDYHQLQEAINLLQQANTQLQNLVNQTGQQGQNNLLTQTAQNIEGITRNIRDENAAWRQLEEQRRQQHEAEMQRQREQQQQLRTTLDLINSIAAAFNIGGSISSATSTFANSIGNAFSAMSGVFDTDVARYATASLTHQFMRNLVGSIPNVTSRYDILRTFVPYMQLTGVGPIAASTAQDRINESILGLPIGLDEATQRLRRYYMYTGDLERATNLTIGVQNAITAGGSSQAYKTQAYNMMERMLATGDLTNIRQWQALLVGLGVSQSFIEQELGLDRGTLMASIREGTIGVEDFLGAIERLGTGATAAAVQMNSALEIYKTTLESWISNIQFAVTRGNERVLGALNDTLEAVSDKGLTGYMKDYRDFLNDLFTGIARFLKNNPDMVKQFLSDVTTLFDAFSKISASSIATQVAGRITELVNGFVYLFEKIPKDRLESFIAFATTIAGPLGRLFEVVASGAPYVIAVFNRFEHFDFQLLIDAIVRNVDSLAKFLETLLNFLTDKQLADIIAFGLTYGKPLAAVLTAIGHAVSTIGTFFAMGGGERVISVLLALGNFFTAIAPAIGALAATAGTIGLEYAIFNRIRNDDISLLTANGGRQAFGSNANLLNMLADETGKRTIFGHTFGGLLLDALRIAANERGLDQPGVHLNGSRTSVHGGGGGSFANYKGITESLTGMANRFAWLETDSAWNDMTIADHALAEANAISAATVQIAQDFMVQELAYQELYNTAKESLEGQISLWQELELNKPHYVAEDAGNSKANMEKNTEILDRYTDSLTYISEYVAAHPEAAGYIGQMVGSLSLEDLPTLENLVAYIEAGKELPLDAWNALADAINRAADAAARFYQITAEKEYTYEEGLSVIEQIFGDDPGVLEVYDKMWGDAEKMTESGLSWIEKTVYKYLSDTKRVTEKQIEEIDGAFMEFGYDPQWFFNTAEAMMMALRAGIITAGDKAIWEARRVAYNVQHAFDGITYGHNPDDDGKDYIMSGWHSIGGLIYAANGKLINFVPRGTDTVPAMLTPGEFVMRKQAVDTFGAAFMKSINDLNIGAAFDRLINTKLSNPRGFVNNTYNNRDDHSTHIQNIKTNNPAFAARRAGRFVRAMA